MPETQPKRIDDVNYHKFACRFKLEQQSVESPKSSKRKKKLQVKPFSANDEPQVKIHIWPLASTFRVLK